MSTVSVNDELEGIQAVLSEDFKLSMRENIKPVNIEIAVKASAKVINDSNCWDIFSWY